MNVNEREQQQSRPRQAGGPDPLPDRVLPGDLALSASPVAVVSAAAAGRWTWRGETFSVAPAPRVFGADPESLARAFPGRWNARRELPAGLDTLVAAFALGLGEAGWWTAGEGKAAEGGLTLGSDFQSLGVARRYATDLGRSGPSGISPSDFLFSLPSSPAAILGILFGLRHYQATLTGGGQSGFQALQHAADRIALGRADRLAAGALTIVLPGMGEPLESIGHEGAAASPDGTMELAVVLCLERSEATERSRTPTCSAWFVSGPAGDGDGVPRDTAGLLEDLPAGFRGLAAPSLLAVLRIRDRLIAGDEVPATVSLAHRSGRGATSPPLRLSLSGAPGQTPDGRQRP